MARLCECGCKKKIASDFKFKRVKQNNNKVGG